ncbi:MAG: GntR family transcriptional regulator, partial [Pseudomonas sp.]|uniref:winged helix-turn-helix domain-containing protein n=1 Tax=Pseudomonas sp. TaxID=306 RepID=UPI00120388CB
MPLSDDDRKRGLSRALYAEIRERIADGTYLTGSALPSTRSLAMERGLSRGTVSLVYEQLAADGFLETRPGAASRVSAGAATPAPIPRTRHPRVETQMLSAGHGPALSSIGRHIASLKVQDVEPIDSAEIDFVY